MAPVSETIADNGNKQLTDNSIDPNVVMPAHVRQAAERAENFYKDPAAAAAAVDNGLVDPQELQAVQQEIVPPVEPQPQPQPVIQQQIPVPTQDDLSNDNWAGRYNSMRGRWQASQQEVGALQQQLVQVGDELARVNQLLDRAGVQGRDQGAGEQPQRGHDHKKLITDEDRQTFGDDLIDVTRRAAQEVLGPEIEALRSQNAELKADQVQRLKTACRASVANVIPNWKAIQAMPEWSLFMRKPNVYTGRARNEMFKDAYGAGNPAPIIALFQDFIREVQATGGTAPSNQPAPQPAAQQRQPAVDLTTLAAPGRARPASSENQAPADKPLYTRAQISSFYRDVRVGAYAGREDLKNATEQDIIRAQSEGRVRG